MLAQSVHEEYFKRYSVIKKLPRVVFSMKGEFTHGDVEEELKKRTDSLVQFSDDESLYIELKVDIYLENLVNYGLVVRNGSKFRLQEYTTIINHGRRVRVPVHYQRWHHG